MANFLNIDLSNLKEFEAKLKSLNGKGKKDDLMKFLARDLSSTLLNSIIFRTPVDTGHLRRGWTGGVDNISGYEFARGLPVESSGNRYVIHLKNSVRYASYVEYGHRQAGASNRWVNGRFMCTKSLALVRSRYPIIAKRIVEEWLRGELDV